MSGLLASVRRILRISPEDVVKSLSMSMESLELAESGHYPPPRKLSDFYATKIGLNGDYMALLLIGSSIRVIGFPVIRRAVIFCLNKYLKLVLWMDAHAPREQKK